MPGLSASTTKPVNAEPARACVGTRSSLRVRVRAWIWVRVTVRIRISLRGDMELKCIGEVEVRCVQVEGEVYA